MITDPMGLVAALLAIEGVILFASGRPRAAFIFKYLPSMFWIYFLPMIAHTVGLIPATSEVYGVITQYCLPASLVLLLLSVDIRAIARLGPLALLVMLVGSAGIVIGGPLMMMVFKPWLGPDMWSGFGALSASWVGGSANMIAVKEGLKSPDHVFLPMVVVDTIVPYAWMGLLILLSGYQATYDRWNRSRGSIVEDLTRRTQADEQVRQPLTLEHLSVILAIAAAGAFGATFLGKGVLWGIDASPFLSGTLGGVKNFLNAYAMTIIMATFIGMGLSFTPAKKLEGYGASRVGYLLLYLVLASIGAKTGLAHLAAAPILIVIGCVWVLFHASLLVGVSRVFKVPMSLLASASQANVGGVASAPIVAGIYQPALAPVGLLMAIFGNIIGTYTGLFCGWLCKMVSGG